MEKVNIAIVGYGGMGGWHTDRILEMDKFNLCGVWDIDPERLEIARGKGIHTYSSFEEVLKDEQVELLTIATWNDVHKPLAIEAMRAGKNVISEKPVTMTVKDLEDMIKVSEETGRLFTVHQNRRWDNDYLTMKNIVDKNTLGRVFRIESRVQGSRGIPGDWRKEKGHGGGMLLDWGVHLLDQALTLNDSNPIKSIWAKMTNITNDECDDGFYTELTFENGLSDYVEVTTNNFITLPRWYILGENGSSVIEDWDLKGKSVLVHNWDKIDSVPVKAGTGITKTMAPRTDETIHEQPLEEVYGEWVQYYDNIYDVIRNGAVQTVNHRQMKRCIAVIEAIVYAAQNNCVVEFNDIYTAQ
ncbi:MAG: Gfo/Idh/MocA family oxidoreductase [Clostridia bacterium]|nr:Gfo/Idh/MocA family oxidoreductase [Clostridia bacterium]